jgi:PAS domain S-box-containing protein
MGTAQVPAGGPSVRGYIALWVAIAAVSATTFIAIDGLSSVELWIVGLYVAAVVAAERLELAVSFERREALFTLVEMAITAGLLLLPLGMVVTSTAGAMLIAQVSRRFDAQKVAFNTATATAGVSFAAAVVAFAPVVGPTIAGRSVLTVLAGMVGYVVINAVAMAGLLLRLTGPGTRDLLREQIPLTALAMLGTTAGGVIAAALWEIEPALTVLALAPAAAVHLAARGAQRSQELLVTIRSERDRLARVVDGASDGIVLLGRDGEVQVWSQAMSAMTGWSDAEVVGRSVAEVLTDDVRVADEPVRGRWLLDDATTRAPVVELAAALRHRDGTQRQVIENHGLVFDDRGRAIGDVVVVRDVTRQAELERLRSDFVARVSHELRTPLTPIRGFANILLRRGDTMSAEQRQDALTTIAARADHLGDMVEDLLLVTSVDRGEVATLIEARASDLRPIVAAAVDGARQSTPPRTIAVSVPDDLPAGWVDPARLEQVLDAVLDNACRYSPPDGPIEVDVDHLGDDLIIRVRDHGPGIPVEQREAVFERFHRLEDPMTMTTSGVGLGLYLARQLTDAMHGRIAVESPTSGSGIVMTVRVPVAVGGQGAAPVPQGRGV